MDKNPTYNPNTGNRKGLPQRKSIRLKGYDYSRSGLYFITVCCQDRICRFGQVAKGEMVLNECGQIAYDEWINLSKRFPHFELDVFQIMPNHMHGIVALVGATLAVAPNDIDRNDAVARNDIDQNDAVAPNDIDQNDAVARNDIAQNDGDVRLGADGGFRAGASPAPTATTVGDIVGAYKSLVANGCLGIYKSKNKLMGKLWQRNYYEHIIRNELSYQRISKYIINNPKNWQGDKFFST